MAVKHLHELLQEEQEPFKLKSFIAQRRSQFNTPTTKPTLQFEKHIPIPSKLTSQQILCKQACFFSFQNSPDVTQSPFFDIPRPPATMRIPIENPNSVRPVKQQSKKPNSQIEPTERFGVFGSILKKLSGKKSCRSREILCDASLYPSRNPAPEKLVTGKRKSSFEKTTLFESLERDYDDMDIFVPSATLGGENGHFSTCDSHLCSSPLSPFRFSLHSSPSSSSRTPIFTSPATSPGGPTKQENCEEKIIVEAGQDEKEQCSPVSILDPPFADDDDGHEDDNDNGNDDYGYDCECSYETLQRSKNQLLLKLQRFEKLVELDPIELERLLLEDDEDGSESENVEEDIGEGQLNVQCLVTEVLSNSGHHLRKASSDMKKLVSDLVSEEERHKDDDGNNELVVTRVCQRLDSWKEMKSTTTVEMMAERDAVKVFDGRKSNDQEVIIGEIAMEIANDIFGMLVEELSDEVVVVCGVWRRESITDFIDVIPFSF